MSRVCGSRSAHTVALDGLDLEVRAGEVHGFLGPNGSGKSTTIRVLLGLLRADGGTVELLGGDPWREGAALHRRLAYVPGDVSLWPELTGGEVIDLLGRLRGGLDPRAPRRAAGAIRAGPDEEGPRPTRRATARRWRSSPPSPPTSSCCCSTSPPRDSTRSWSRCSGSCIVDERGSGRTVLLSSHILVGGRGPLRPGEHHPPGRHRGDRDARRAASPHPHRDQRRGRRPPRRPRRSPVCTTSRCKTLDGSRVRVHCQVDAATSATCCGASPTPGVREPDEPASDARGPVPPALRRHLRRPPPRRSGRRPERSAPRRDRCARPPGPSA